MSSLGGLTQPFYFCAIQSEGFDPGEPFCHLLFLHFSVFSLRFILTEPHFSLPSLQFNPRKPLEGLLSLCSLLPSHSCLTSPVLSTLPSSSHLPHSSPALCSFPAWSSPAHPAACGSWARRRSCRPASNPDGCSCSSWLHNQRALLHYLLLKCKHLSKRC